MFTIRRFAFCVGVIAAISLVEAGSVSAGWETGAKVGFDTDVSRSISGGKSDSYLQGYAAYGREPDGETRLDWSFSAVGEAAAYASLNDLDYATITFSPGLVYFYRPGWIITGAPFLRAKGVRDSNQSAVAFGGKFLVKQQLPSDFYLGEYYTYADSRANADTFSFTEHALGAFLGRNWTRTFYTELGYEFSRGDSFRSVGTSPSVQGGTGGFGGGMHSMFSTAFGTEVVRERVNRHAVGVTAGIDWTKKVFSAASYTFTDRLGDLGSSSSHSGFLGVGYRF
ncbi:MAG: hypothetical protein A2Z40_05405 [Deltaproteobacteria bacterium RBG_19FT_COMBO_60_16]|nr:MAG: hypothetical protein XU12_C0006G0058 [Deltaproteobacteria bacterium CSP1-8]OGQ01270.1 MAG: hypothetical protein A2Z40_05405 [Deltaproteobacteria bacterium RBG_19FT_COMBO_60_16]